MYALTVFTPVIPDRLEQLRAYLAGLPQEPSPFAGLGATHFARWVVVPDFVSDPKQPEPEHLPSPYLLFSATFDGDLDVYLDDLCRQLSTEAQEIWGCCLGAPDPAGGAPLKDYLKHNQIETGLFFAAYPEARVSDVRQALDVRSKMISLAVSGQAMDPAALQQAFIEGFEP
jgi:hypothetical protein